MRKPLSRWNFGWAMALLLTALPQQAMACATCFGRSDDPMAQGMNMGILTLLIVIMGVLFGIAVFFAYILRRAARMESEAQQNRASTDSAGVAAS